MDLATLFDSLANKEIPSRPTGFIAQSATMPSRLDPALDSNNVTAALRGVGIYKSRKPSFPLFAKKGSSSNRGGFKKHVKPTTQEFDSIKVASSPPMMATKLIPPV
jgi:hypothetical protein